MPGQYGVIFKAVEPLKEDTRNILVRLDEITTRLDDITQRLTRLDAILTARK